MKQKTKCTKCHTEFEVSLNLIHDTREYKDVLDESYPPKLYCQLRYRKQFTKCQLCRNIGKAFDYINEAMR